MWYQPLFCYGNALLLAVSVTSIYKSFKKQPNVQSNEIYMIITIILIILQSITRTCSIICEIGILDNTRSKEVSFIFNMTNLCAEFLQLSLIGFMMVKVSGTVHEQRRSIVLQAGEHTVLLNGAKEEKLPLYSSNALKKREVHISVQSNRVAPRDFQEEKERFTEALDKSSKSARCSLDI